MEVLSYMEEGLDYIKQRITLVFDVDTEELLRKADVIAQCMCSTVRTLHP